MSYVPGYEVVKIGTRPIPLNPDVCKHSQGVSKLELQTQLLLLFAILSFYIIFILTSQTPSLPTSSFHGVKNSNLFYHRDEKIFYIYFFFDLVLRYTK
mgnify:CR=1 FL=1